MENGCGFRLEKIKRRENKIEKILEQRGEKLENGGFLGVKIGILPLGRCAPKKRTEARKKRLKIERFWLETKKASRK